MTKWIIILKEIKVTSVNNVNSIFFLSVQLCVLLFCVYHWFFLVFVHGMCASVKQFSSLMAWGLKLSLSLLVQVQMLLYHLSEGRSIKSLWLEWLRSEKIRRAYLLQRWLYRSLTTSSSDLARCCADLSTLCRVLQLRVEQLPYQAMMLPVRMFLMVLL